MVAICWLAVYVHANYYKSSVSCASDALSVQLLTLSLLHWKNLAEFADVTGRTGVYFWIPNGQVKILLKYFK